MIAGRYDIAQEIGAGGMGMVYRGVDTTTGQPIAIKQLNADIIKVNPEILERFAREGAALRDLNHPNIVRMLDMVREGGQTYLIMEYVSGGDLRSLMRDAALPLKQILRWGIDLADALTRAHKLNIVHRDLKPDNVLLAEDGTVKLADFGVAFVGGEEGLTSAGQAVGTMDYMAPEILQGATVDPRSDIWAFGVLLFEMLAGQRPFKRDTMTAVITAILTENVPDLEALRPDLPIALIDLVYRMLAKNPQERISSVRHVGAILEDVLYERDTDSNTLIHTITFTQSRPDILLTPVTRHNLPVQTTAFVGREAELAEVARLLAQPETHLVTILAPGGMGKTRLAIEAAAGQLGNFPAGVFVIELAPLSDENGVLSRLAEILGYQFQQETRTPRAQLLDYLRTQTLLLVLDNCEHLLDICAGLVADITASAPGVKILATSRQRINHTGEALFNLGGMEVGALDSIPQALENPAVALFLQHAGRIQPSFALTTATLPPVAEICRILQGMPLGIVLAASWLAMLSPEEIVDEIQQNLDFLETSMSDIPARQRSIRAVFDYSWQLMSAEERQIFMKLAVFRGGFTRAAAQTVAGASLSALMGLLNKSLIGRHADSGRFTVHEMLRQYALEMLTAAGREAATLDAHLEFFAAFVEAQEIAIKNRGQVKGLETLRADFENVRAAWKYALETRQEAPLNRMLEGVKLFVEIYNRYQEREQFFITYRQALFPTPAPDNALWRRMFVRYAGFLAHREDVRAEFEACLNAAQALSDAHETAYSWLALGDARSSQRDIRGAFAAYTEALSAYQALGDDFYVCKVSNRLASAALFTGQSEASTEYASIGLTYGERCGNLYDMGWSLHSIGSAAAYLGDWEGCKARFEAATHIWEQLGSQEGLITALSVLGWASLMHEGNLPRTKERISTAYHMAEKTQNPIRLGYGYINLALLNLLENRSEEALRYAEQCIQITRNAPFLQTGFLPIYGLAACAQGRFDVAQASIVQGVKLGGMIQAWGYLLPIFVVAALERLHAGEAEAAAAFWGFYLSQPIALKGFIPHVDMVRDLPAQLEAALGTDAYQQAVERGAVWTIAEASEKALSGVPSPG